LRNTPWYRRIFGRSLAPGGSLAHGECAEARANASGYVDGDIAPTLGDRIKRHLGVCQGCDGWVKSLGATVGLLRALPKEQPPESLRQAIRDASRE
jgi:predicted anti-sigma-YlaC factor YlaD